MIIYYMYFPCSRTGTLFRSLGILVLLSVFLALPLFQASILAFQPNTIKLGTVEVHPSFESKVTFGSNIGLTQEAVSDVIFEQTPGIIFQWEKSDIPAKRPRFANAQGLSIDFLLDLYLMRIQPMGERGYMGKGTPQYFSGGKPLESALMSAQKLRRYSFFLEYEPKMVNLVNNPEYNGIDHEFSCAGAIRFPGGVYLRLDDTFLSTSSIASYRNDIVNLTADQRLQGIGYQTNILALTLGYNFYSEYALFLTYINYLFFIPDFDASLAFQDMPLLPWLEIDWTGIDAGTMGLVAHSVGAYLATNIRKKTNLAIGYVFGKTKGNLDEFGLEASLLGGLLPVSVTSTSDPRNATFQEARLGFQRALTAHDVVMGWPVPKTLLEVELAYQWRQFETFSLLLEVDGLPVGDYSFTPEDYNRFHVKVRLYTELGPRTTLKISYNSYPIEAISGTGNLAFAHQAGLALTQKLAMKWLLVTRADYRYTQLNTADNNSEQSLSLYKAEATLGYNIQTWFQTALSYQFLAQRGEMDYNQFDSHRCYLEIAFHF